MPVETLERCRKDYVDRLEAAKQRHKELNNAVLDEEDSIRTYVEEIRRFDLAIEAIKERYPG